MAVRRPVRRAWWAGFTLAVVNLLAGWLFKNAIGLLLGFALLLVAGWTYQGGRMAAVILTGLCALQTIWAFRMYIHNTNPLDLIVTALLGWATWLAYKASLGPGPVAREASPPDAA